MRLRCIFQDSVCTDDLLLKLPNVMTPDLARLPAETIERSVAGVAENCPRLRVGDALLHRVGVRTGEWRGRGSDRQVGKKRLRQIVGCRPEVRRSAAALPSSLAAQNGPL